jgi:precorrin-2 dehydrogenase/sirohydrochlorin ferrochelatase
MNIEGKPVVVVGGGKVALRKVVSLLESGATVTVVSPRVELELKNLSEERRITWIPEPFDEALLDHDPTPVLIFGTTDSNEANVRIHKAATVRRIPCNIADVPDLCTFTVPAVLSRGDLTIAVSTGGASPALARRIREELEACYGPEYAAATEILGALRKQILRDGGSSDENRKIFFRIVDSALVSALRERDEAKALAVLESLLPGYIDPEPAVRKALEGLAREG